jgi:hypothetical protein
VNWKRYEIGGDDGYLLLETRGDGDGDPVKITYSSAVHAYGAQHETLSDNKIVYYPSSYIPTGNMEKTREADTLFSAFPSEILPLGYFDVELRFAPNYASDQWTESRHDLVYIDEANRVTMELAAAGGTLLLKSHNTELKATVAATWARDQELRIIARSTPTIRELSLEIASVGIFSISDMDVGPSPTNKNVYILGDASGAQECADLRYIGFFPPK